MRWLNDILREGQFPLWDNLIFLCYRGSIAHGTYVLNSNPGSIDDKDVFGVVFPPREYFYGLKTFEQLERKKEYWDVLVYDFRKFIHLMTKSNPNVLQALWTPEHHMLKVTPVYQKLVEHRDIFLSKAIYKSFCGYAYGQLHKMENMAYNGYMGEKRKGLVDKFGYDTKNAQHLIRLLRQGIEALQTGEIVVERPDANELKKIKLGDWSIEKVKRTANELFDAMKIALKESRLPERPDMEAIDKLVQEIQIEHYQSGG